MPNYYISAVSRADQHNIARVRAHRVLGSASVDESGMILTVNQVLLALRQGETFMTALRHKKEWQEGQQVQIDRAIHIRTDGDQEAADSLENLPEF